MSVAHPYKHRQKKARARKTRERTSCVPPAVKTDNKSALAKALRVKPEYLADPHDYTLGAALYQFQLYSEPNKQSVLTIRFPRALDTAEIICLTSRWSARYDLATCLTVADETALLHRVLDEFCDNSSIPEWRTVRNPIAGIFTLDT